MSKIHQAISIRHIKKVALLAPLLIIAIFFSANAMADGKNDAGDADGGLNRDCGCACYPNTCRNGGFDWIYQPFNGQDTVTIPKKSRVYYLEELTVSRAACGNADGFYFYTMVDRDGSPMGVTRMGSTSASWRPPALNGTAHYRGSMFSWNDITQEYANSYGVDPANFEGKGFGDVEMGNETSKLGWFCGQAAVKPDTPPPPPPEEKPDECPVEGFILGEDRGNSIAESAVVNLSKGEPWDLHTSRNGDSITYAKPGDSIQFKHAYCYGASAVKWNEEHGGTTTNVTATNSFSISAGSTNGGSKEYRFGGAGTNAKTKLQADIFDEEIFFTLGPGTHKVSALDPVVDYNDDYFFVTYSPSVTAGDRYDCLHQPFINTNPFRSPGYQINGFTQVQGSCKSKAEVKQKNDPGTIISQMLEWSKTRAWITKGHDDEGNCDCHEHSRTIANFDRPKFDSNEGSRAGHIWTEPDHITGGNICKQNVDCCDEWDNEGNCLDPFKGYSSNTSIWRPYKKEWENEKAMEVVQAVIPYNYNTHASSSISAGDTVYIGEGISTSFSWGLSPRSNPDVYQYSYATISRPTRIQFVEFIVSPDTSGSQDKVTGSKKSSSDPCSYYSGKLGAQGCHAIEDRSDSIMNEKGYYTGSPSYSDGFSRQLPDVDPGTKYCVAMGLWPSDSHNQPGASLGEGVNHPNNKDFNGQPSDFGYWNISNASCRTLYKKPNFQVWGAGIFTNGGIKTSISEKANLGGGLSSEQGNNWHGATNIFGSWDEYAVIARGDVEQFASAAGYGYQKGLQLLPTGGASNGTDFCDGLSKLTLGPCGNDKIAGNANVNVSDTMINRLRSRYTLSSGEIARLAQDDSKCYATPASKCGVIKESNITYVKTNGNATIGSNLIARASTVVNGVSNNQGTIVIDASGSTLTINSNICYLDGDCNNNNVSDVKLRSNTSSVNNIATLPQVIIFAKNINISENVSQIDAWLIADGGNVNTCSQFASGSANEGSDTIGTDTTRCNKILTVNGPVFAKTLTLNRTAGANPGGGVKDGTAGQPHTHNLANDGSITPAEIFNLRPDVYYWSYGQAQRYSQAVVTYSRELAPRY